MTTTMINVLLLYTFNSVALHISLNHKFYITKSNIGRHKTGKRAPLCLETWRPSGLNYCMEFRKYVQSIEATLFISTTVQIRSCLPSHFKTLQGSCTRQHSWLKFSHWI